MKKTLVFLCVAAFMLMSVNLFADAIDNVSPWSAQYFRMLARAASTDVDAASYNPAGTTKLKDGLYVQAANSVIMDKMEQKPATGTKTEGEMNVYILPAAQIVYKMDVMAFFLAYTIPGGGGTIEYDKGGPTSNYLAYELGSGLAAQLAGLGGTASNFTSKDLKGSSTYHNIKAGGAYAINDMISLAAAGSYLIAKNTLEAKLGWDFEIAGPQTAHYDASVEKEYEAKGYSGTVGVNLSPSKELNVGITYTSVTKLDFKEKTKTADVVTSNQSLGWEPTLNAVPPAAGGPLSSAALETGLENGIKEGDAKKERRDLPAVIGIGASYLVMPEMLVAVSCTYFFNKQATWEDKDTDKEEQDEFDNSMELAIGVEYTIMPALKASVGFAYVDVGTDDDNAKYDTPESPALDQYAFAIGAQYEAIPGLLINAGYVKVLYKEYEADLGSKTKVSRDRNAFSLGITYKIM